MTWLPLTSRPMYFLIRPWKMRSSRSPSTARAVACSDATVSVRESRTLSRRLRTPDAESLMFGSLAICSGDIPKTLRFQIWTSFSSDAS